MSVTTSVKLEAGDPKHGMTLGELAAFVQEALDARADLHAPVKAMANIRGGIKKLEARP